MNTLVELFDFCQLENVASFLKFNPKKIIYIGFSDHDFSERYRAITDVIKKINPYTKTEYITVDRYNYDEMLEKFETIIRNNPNCFFDLTGGKELVLAAMGATSVKYDVPMYQINLRSNELIKVHGCNALPLDDNHRLTLSDSLTLNCALLESFEAPKIDDSFSQTAKRIWSIAKKDNSMWNNETKYLMQFEKKDPVSATGNEVASDIQFFYSEKPMFSNLFSALKSNGFITTYTDGKRFIYRYKNPAIRPFLEKSGTILEAYTYSLVKAVEQRNSNTIHDVSMQIKVSWVEGGIASTVKNEIDVALMQENIPVFISCKHGEVLKSSLYELNTIANRLGGKYAKKILIATKLNKKQPSQKAILARAEKMNISIISNISNRSHKEIEEQIEKILFG